MFQIEKENLVDEMDVTSGPWIIPNSIFQIEKANLIDEMGVTPGTWLFPNACGIS